jgi:ABC-type phosphate transport system permease subunit
LIFTIFGSQFFVFRPTAPMAAMPLTIYTNATQAYPDAQRTAWGTALVLMVLVVVISVAARAVAAHMNRKTK